MKKEELLVALENAVNLTSINAVLDTLSKVCASKAYDVVKARTKLRREGRATIEDTMAYNREEIEWRDYSWRIKKLNYELGKR